MQHEQDNIIQHKLQNAEYIHNTYKNIYGN